MVEFKGASLNIDVAGEAIGGTSAEGNGACAGLDDTAVRLRHPRQPIDQLPVLEETAALSARTEGLLAGREASEILQSGLEKLSPELRETLILRDLEEMEYKEIAQVLNVPEGTVKSRLNRGRAELARILRKHKVAV